MSALRRSSGLAALSALVACCASCESCSGDGPDGSSSSAPPRGATTMTKALVAAADASADRGDPDRLDLRTEEGFQAAHHRRGDAGALRRGTEVELATGRGYLSLPEPAEPPQAAVLIAHGRLGLNDHAALWADRLADDGYGALAVDLYQGALPLEPDQIDAKLEALDEAQVLELLQEGLEFLASDPRIRAAHRGVLGWGPGAQWAVELATREPRLGAVVVYYGPGTADASRLAHLECPLLALFGKTDDRLPRAAADRFEMGLEQAGGKRYQVVQLDAGHGFADPSAAGYDPAAATEAWAQTRSFLREHLEREAKEPGKQHQE